jgi:uncharacterized protein (TIGR04255 family)
MPDSSLPDVSSLHAPFGETPRVLYERNPLDGVICQVRFPPILRIEAQLPDAFQDRIRDMFPIYTEQTSAVMGGVQLPDEILRVVRGNLPGLLQRPPRTFSSEDGNWSVALTKDFLALSVKKYKRWEEFRQHLQPALDALHDVYAPTFYSRIGVRYKDLIRRSALGLEGAEWRELLQHALPGELADPQMSKCVDEVLTVTLIKLPELQARVRLQHGLVIDNDEPCYVLDNDLFTEQRTERTDVHSTLQYFSAQAHRLFRWCITERLHNAMGPQPLPPRGIVD